MIFSATIACIASAAAVLLLMRTDGFLTAQGPTAPSRGGQQGSPIFLDFQPRVIDGLGVDSFNDCTRCVRHTCARPGPCYMDTGSFLGWPGSWQYTQRLPPV